MKAWSADRKTEVEIPEDEVDPRMFVNDELEWRRCEKFPDYEVSEFGDVRRCVDGVTRKSGFILSGSVNQDGYRAFILRRDGRSRHVLAHQLVAQAFYGAKPSEGHQVAHWDGDRLNNYYRNLRWATVLENQQDAARHGSRKGEKQASSVLTDNTVREARRRAKSGETVTKLSKIYGVSTAALSSAVRGKTWGHIEGALDHSYSHGKSGYRGVHWHSGRQLWHVKIKQDNKTIFLGQFKNKSDAIQKVEDFYSAQ
jgi:hypothetical protein